MSEATRPGFERHLFVCTNQRAADHPRGCCDGAGGADLLFRFKKALSDRGLKGRLRANKAGCLDHCEHGPVVVVYPEGVWYGGVAPADVESIVDEHLVGGRPVERLLIRARLPRRG
jgi:(2Fe-2S) ferredoxin